MEAGEVPPPELSDIPLRKRGRPPLSDEAIELPEHTWARKQRAYRAAVADAKIHVDVSEAALALTQLAVPAVEALAEQRAAEALRKLRKLERAQRQLAERNPEGVAGLLLKQAGASGMHGPCIVCFEDVHTITPC